MRTGTGIIWGCEKRDGRAVVLQLLRRTFAPQSINPLWLHAIHNEDAIAEPWRQGADPTEIKEAVHCGRAFTVGD